LLLCGIALIVTLLEPLAPGRMKLMAQNPSDATGLQRVHFMLAGLRYQILVPEGARVVPPNEQIQFIEIRGPGVTRNVRHFRIGPQAESREKYASHMRLLNGAVLEYTIDPNIGGGSGGPEAQLQGQLHIGTRVLSVTCHDQREGVGSPDPEWCVPYLHHLRIRDYK
jgi:hypothetical protein